MENMSKALIMGASVLLFVIAISIAIYTYSILMGTIDSILTSSEQFAKSAEYFNSSVEDTVRTVSAAEVVGTILDIGTGNDYSYESVSVDGRVFNAGNVKDNNTAIQDILKGGNEYFVSSRDYNNLSITYTEK